MIVIFIILYVIIIYNTYFKLNKTNCDDIFIIFYNITQYGACESYAHACNTAIVDIEINK